MAATYYLLLTEYGSQKMAQMQAGQPIQLTSLAIGDANNQPYLPESRLHETILVHECARVPVQSVIAQANALRVTATIGSEIGGFNIHELALLDDLGNAVYIGNYHGQFKPQLSQGAGGEIELLCEIVAEGLGDVFISYDPLVVSASKQWVTDGFVSKASITGQIAYFSRNTAPTGWLKANGAALSRTIYENLFAVMGTVFGVGDGLTTFNLPDLRGEFIRGFDDGRGVDENRVFGSTQSDALQIHNHYLPTETGTAGNVFVFKDSYSSPNIWNKTMPNYNPSANDETPSITAGFNPSDPNVGTVGVFSKETRPKNITLLACIKY